MRHTVKVYLLPNYFGDQLKEQIEFDQNFELLEDNIAIYKVGEHNIAVLSTHNLVDELVLSKGGIENNDAFLLSLKQKNYSLEFGSTELLALL
jgi:hypothetical protein